MIARLTLAGIRSLSLLIDITNYVMLELGQPIHGYDLDKLRGGITVRRARAGREARDPRRQGAHARPARTCSSPTSRARSAWPASWAAGRPRWATRHGTCSSRRRPSTRSRSRARLAGTSCRPRRPGASSAASTRLVAVAAAAASPTSWSSSPAAPLEDGGASARRAARASAIPLPDGFVSRPHRRRLHRRRDPLARSSRSVRASSEADGGLAGHAADLAPRPHRQVDARRGGRPHRGLRPHPVGAARRASRARSHPRPAPAPRRRNALAAAAYRGRRLPVRQRDGCAPPGSALEGEIAAPVQLANPLDGAGAVPAHLAPARPRGGRAPQRLARLHRPRALRDRPGLPADGAGALRHVPCCPSAARPDAATLAELDASIPPQPRHVAVLLHRQRRRSSPARRAVAGTGGRARRRPASSARRSACELDVEQGERAALHPGRTACSSLAGRDRRLRRRAAARPRGIRRSARYAWSSSSSTSTRSSASPGRDRRRVRCRRIPAATQDVSLVVPRGRAGRRGARRPRRGRRRAARVAAPRRRLPRRRAARRREEPHVRAALPRARPHAHGGRGDRGEARRRRRAAERYGAHAPRLSPALACCDVRRLRRVEQRSDVGEARASTRSVALVELERSRADARSCAICRIASATDRVAPCLPHAPPSRASRASSAVLPPTSGRAPTLGDAAPTAAAVRRGRRRDQPRSAPTLRWNP